MVEVCAVMESCSKGCILSEWLIVCHVIVWDHVQNVLPSLVNAVLAL